MHEAHGHKTFKEFYADAKKKGLKKATWSKNKREYAIVDKKDAKKAEKFTKRIDPKTGAKRIRKIGDKYESTTGTLLSDKGKKLHKARDKFGSHYQSKVGSTDVVGDPEQREQIDTLVGANKGGRIGKQFGGGEGNTKPIGGRANLLEEVGRIDAEKMNPNRRAEKSRVIGELNRGYKKGGLIKGYPKLAKRGW